MGVQQKYLDINKNCFSCFKHEGYLMSIPTSTTKQFLTFAKILYLLALFYKFL